MTRTRSVGACLAGLGVAAALFAGLGSAAPSHPRAAKRPGVLFAARYDHVSGDSMRGVWRAEQEPMGAGIGSPVATDRIRVAANPSPHEHVGPHGKVMRVELRPFDNPDTAGPKDGDVTDTGGYIASRAEVYDRIASRELPASKWPDPEGSTRWYGVSVYVDRKFPTSNDHWLSLMQWKGLRTGSPPLSLALDGTKFKMNGKGFGHQLGPLLEGKWNRLLIGVHFSADPKVGWVSVKLNGTMVFPQTNVATMDTYNDSKTHSTLTDPDYLKQGIYRDKTWPDTQVVFYGPLVIGKTPRAARAAFL